MKQKLAEKAPYYLLALIVLSLDQYTKLLALQHLSYANPVPVFEHLNWTLLFNRGAAFSFLSNAGGWQHWLLGGLAVGVSIFIVVYLYKLPRQAWMLSLALALVLGGAVGNVYDRFTLGYVVDFIDVYLQQCSFLQAWFPACHWPAFNIADAAICVGAILLLLDAFLNADAGKAAP